MGRLILTALVAGFLALLVASCTSDAGTTSSVAVSSPEPTATASPTPEPTLTPTPLVVEGDPLGCPERLTLASQMADEIETALADYEATWGFAFIDVACNSVTSINPEYTQYTASAGKIVSIIAVLQAVERGEVDLAEIEEALLEILTHSLDESTDYIETFLQPGALDAVLEQAGTMTARIDGTWRQANMSATDLARVWAALVDGELLGEEMTGYLLELAQGPDIPDGYETFPDRDFEHAEFEYGQKAGYYVSDGIPYFLVGAGYLHHLPTDEFFIPVILIRTEIVELLDPQRRLVFPIVLDYAEQFEGVADE